MEWSTQVLVSSMGCINASLKGSNFILIAEKFQIIKSYFKKYASKSFDKYNAMQHCSSF